MSERLKNVGKIAVTGFIIYQASNLGFTSRIREKILNRDGGKCVRCGSTDHLEAAHIDHDKGNPKYNDPSNGRTLCTKDHLKDHKNRHGRNGLPKHQNKWAIDRLKERT